MALSFGVGDAIACAELLIKTLSKAKELWEQHKKNKEVLGDLDKFIKEIQIYHDEMQRKKDSGAIAGSGLNALSKLQDDLCIAHDSVVRLFLNKDKCTLKETLKSNKIKQEMDGIRNNVTKSFGTIMLFIVANVTTDTRNDLKQGQTDLKREQEEIKDLMQIIAKEIASNPEKMREVQSLKEKIKAQETDTEKFFMEVLSNVVNIHEENISYYQESTMSFAQWFEDPITKDTMCDPVKASDGRTYDRWTILGYNGETFTHRLTASPFTSQKPFEIVVDDIDLRIRVFSFLPEQHKKFKRMRDDYRCDALDKARLGHLADAESMLNDVLQWDPNDKVCKEKRDEIVECIKCLERPTHQSTLEVHTREPSQLYDVHTKSKLVSGEALLAGQFLVNGNYRLIMQKDDNLVVYYIGQEGDQHIAIWSSRTYGQSKALGPCKLKLEESGVLVIYNGQGTSIWMCQIEMRPDDTMSRRLNETFEFALLSDGGLELTSSERGRIWGTKPKTCLVRGEFLKAGLIIVVGDNKLCMQIDDNLVLYKLGANEHDKAIWASNTKDKAGGKGECTLLLQQNGVLVILDKNKTAIWQNTRAPLTQDDYRLIIMDDGRISIVDHKGRQKWKTGTF